MGLGGDGDPLNSGRMVKGGGGVVGEEKGYGRQRKAKGGEEELFGFAASGRGDGVGWRVKKGRVEKGNFLILAQNVVLSLDRSSGVRGPRVFLKVRLPNTLCALFQFHSLFFQLLRVSPPARRAASHLVLVRPRETVIRVACDV